METQKMETSGNYHRNGAAQHIYLHGTTVVRAAKQCLPMPEVSPPAIHIQSRWYW